MYYIKYGTDYICKGSYIVNGEKYKVVGTIEEARAFKTYLGAQIALDVLEDANTYINIIDCEIVEVILMKVSKEIQNKMHRLAKLTRQASILDREINEYFEGKGYDIDELRAGDGTTLDELNYGNDITNLFVEEFENGKYECFRDTD